MIVTILVGIVCAGLFALIGPIGVILIGLVLALAGIKANKDD